MSASEFLLATVSRVGKSRGVIINNHTMTVQEVREQVELLGRHFDFIGNDELLGVMGASRRRKPFCLLTFDDGKMTNVTVGEELTRLGVPAVFYLTTGFISEGNRPLWFDRWIALGRKLGNFPEELVLQVMLSLPQDVRDERLDRYCEIHGVDADCGDHDVAPMTWASARDLVKSGHTIGAHSRWHPVLTRETLAVAKLEIAQSVEDVSRELANPCKTFAFPNGNYTAELARYALTCGVDTVTTTEPTWVGGQEESWRIPRVQLHAGTSVERQALKIAVAASGNLLTNPDGTGRDYVAIKRMQKNKGR